MRPEVELSRRDLNSPVHSKMDECHLEFADVVAESDTDYLPSTSPLPSNTENLPSTSPLPSNSDTTLPFLSCRNPVWPDTNHAPQNDGIFERSVQATKPSPNYARNNGHSINSDGDVQLTLDRPKNAVENNNNSNNFKLGFKYPQVQNCAPNFCPFLKPDALCDSAAVNNGHDNGINLWQGASDVTSVLNNLEREKFVSFLAETTRRPVLTHQNAVHVEAETIMASQSGEDNPQTPEESLHVPHGNTSPTSPAAQQFPDLYLAPAASTIIHNQSPKLCLSQKSHQPADLVSTKTTNITGTESDRSLSCDSGSLVLGDGVSTDTDEAMRRISFTLSFGSDGSSSGTDLQVKPTCPAGVQVDKGGCVQANTSSNDKAGDCPMLSPALSQREQGEIKTKRSGTSRRANDVKDGKGTLTLRISRSLGNFLKKTPPKSLTLTDMSSTETDATTQTTRNKDGLMDKPSRKKPKRQVSLAGRVMTSLAKLGRKGHSDPPEDDDDEYYNNNKNTPVFVSPGDQVDVVDKVPSLLTQEQCRILKASWLVIKNDVTEVGVETFMGLFNTHPDAIDSFLAFKDKTVQDLERSAVLKAHALRVMQTVDKCISRLDKLDKMAALLMQLGRRHVGYQANIKLIPIIGKQFMAAIEPKMASTWSCEMKAAWEGLFAIINYHMRLGIMDEKNKQIKAAVEAEASRKKHEDRKKREKPR
ncbi:unnamed protein product [Lymnaea stagnalis]|uniref:Globin n=1 Tax=Lymnaea stagnalis TaxID=6523 RepID=A0AAV2HBC1_LYMST